MDARIKSGHDDPACVDIAIPATPSPSREANAPELLQITSLEKQRAQGMPDA
jgi:hypothetical protein